ncbi:hypothetical protein ACTQ49_02520 [Luteococcus sp. Sow4_B9]|uniref:hypothetical protein n=1 Tax=Luteococcus sp. Sow4_B9 TaxID=3438792 RepID=UPI003F99AAF9
MPAQALIHWGGLEIQLSPDGHVADVSCQDRQVLGGLAVRLEDRWQLERTDFLLDEVEQHYRLETEGALQARAIVRQVFDETWSLRLQVQNLTDVEIAVPGAWLELDSVWPARTWLAGAEGQISIDAQRDDAQLLTFTQLRGRSRFSEGRRWLTDRPIRLTASGTPRAGYQVSWRADWLRDERVQAAALPRWWPERTVMLDLQDEVRLELPDAAVEAAGIHVLQDDETTWLTAQEGVHLAQVHAGRGTTDVELAWAGDLVTDHVRPAVEALSRRDPRKLGAAEVFLLGRAARLGQGAAVEPDHQIQAVESLVARPGALPPLALAAAADLLMHGGPVGLVDELPELAERVPLQPGAVTCLLHATLASRLVGGAEQLPMPSGTVQSTPAGAAVAEAIVRMELQALRPADVMPPQVRRVLSLLGPGLPGRTVDPLTRAIIWASSSSLPEQWEVPQWPVPLARVREDARGRLLAEHCDVEALAWLLW